MSNPVPHPQTLLPLLCCVALACGGESEPTPVTGPRLVLLFAPCTVTRSNLSPYDEEVGYTPHLAAFARDAQVFTRHQTEAGVSGIAYASLFSGVQAHRHGVFAHPKKLKDSLYLVSEAFAEAGYDTFFWGKHVMASPALNYAQGVPPDHTFKSILRPGHPAFQVILERLRSDPEYRVFIATNFTVTHVPYASNQLFAFCARYPEECDALEGLEPGQVARLAAVYREHWIPISLDFDNQVERLGLSPESVAALVDVVDRLYRSRIRVLDEIFGAVVDALREAGVLDESLVVFTADHGDVLFRENALFKWSHGYQLAPEILNVPLLIRAPSLGVPAGRYEGVTRSIDVFPTMASLAEVPLGDPDAVQGVDLSEALRDGAPPPGLQAFSHTTLMHPVMYERARRAELFRRFYPRQDIDLMWVSLREGDRVTKYRNQGDEKFGFEAFQLETDPEETSDLFDPEDAEQRRVVKALSDYKKRLVDGYRGDDYSSSSNVEDDTAEDLLRSLGYIE
jgi:arylsulfatase A-like enzyme